MRSKRFFLGMSIALGCTATFLAFAAFKWGTETATAQAPSPTLLPLTNPSFETGPYGPGNNISSWEVSPGMNQTETYIVDGNQFGPKQDGTYYAKLQRGSQAGDKYVASNWIETNENVSGKSYRLSFSIRSHNPTASVSAIVVQRFPKDGTDWTQVGAYLPVVEATNTWQAKAYNLTMPTPTNGNNSTKLRIVLRGNSETYIQPIYYDNVKLEKLGESSLSCGNSCSSNTQCADGLSCYQPMRYEGNNWSQVTTANELGSGPITAFEVLYAAGGTRYQALVRNGIIYFQKGDDSQPWQLVDLACTQEDTNASCCQASGTCGESLLENPNDKIYGINLFQKDATQIEVHLTRQASGVYAKTLNLEELDQFPTLLKQSAGWSNVTEMAGFNQLEGEYYLSFTQGNDAKGNRIQHIVKFDGGEPYTSYAFRRYGWLNRGWSHWIPLPESTNQTRDMEYEFGNKSTEGVIVSLDPIVANNTQYSYLIRGKINLANTIYSLTDTSLHSYDPDAISFQAGVCRNVFNPTNSCDGELSQPDNLSVTFRCTDGVAALSWSKNSSTGSVPNYYEIAACRTGQCTTNEAKEQNIVDKIGYNASGTGAYTGTIEGGYTKGQAYDFAIRAALYENQSRVKAGPWTSMVTKTMAGPTGDMDFDCDVDIADYTNYLNALRSPYANPSIFERMIYFFNSLISNMGTRN